MTGAPTCLADVAVFDGERVIGPTSVLFGHHGIEAIEPGLRPPEDSTVIDGRGKTLLPGLIDSHVHAKDGALEQAIAFGVTTELDMGSDPDWMRGLRAAQSLRYDLASVRSSSFGATVEGGWPSAAIGTFFPRPFPVVSGIDDVAGYVNDRVAEGADYIKLFIDDGSALGLTVPTMSPELSTEIVRQAHRHGLLAVAHAMTIDGAWQAVDSGVDGLVHVFLDQEASPAIVAAIAAADIFVVPTLCAVGAMAGDLDGAGLAHDPRTAGLLSAEWAENLCRCSVSGGPARIEHAMGTVTALHAAGVEILAGTDAACVGVLGSAHGVSVHGELELLVRCGLSPVQALTAATSAPARRFGLAGLGAVRVGHEADLVLVDGDPTTRISDTLSIDSIWRAGRRLDREAYRRALADGSDPEAG